MSLLTYYNTYFSCIYYSTKLLGFKLVKEHILVTSEVVV